MIDIEKSKNELEKFLLKYDKKNRKILLKIEHTYRTAKISKEIAKSLNLDEENIQLAELIGLLHDIGRFEQAKIYDTFDDKKSIDHADFAVEMLFKENLIEKFIDERKFNELGVSKAFAYNLIKKFNNELKQKGFTTITGKVSRKYFEEQFYGMSDTNKEGA